MIVCERYIFRLVLRMLVLEVSLFHKLCFALNLHFFLVAS